MERFAMWRFVSWGAWILWRARWKAWRRSRVLVGGQVRWMCVRFGKGGNIEVSDVGDGSAYFEGELVGKVMVRWLQCCAMLLSADD